MRFEGPGATGGIVEEELFGKSNFERANRIESSDYKYANMRISFEVLKNLQPFDKTDPTPDFANTVHYHVFEGLGLDAEDLRFFTAVKSPLDRFHGIDGWFEIGDEGDPKRVTVDITMNPNKDTGYKADIIFLIPKGGLDRKVDKEQFLEYSQKLADEVMAFFKMRGMEANVA